MPITRRETIVASAAFVGTLAMRADATPKGNDLLQTISEFNAKLVPAQVRTCRVTHSGGIEYSFLLEDFKKFANMKGCKLIMQNNGIYRHPECVNLPPWREYLSVFSSAENGSLDLSTTEISGVIQGDDAVCRRLNLYQVALAAPKLAYRRNWSVRRYAQCLDGVGIDANLLFERCKIVESDKELAAYGRENPDVLLIGLGGSDFGGLRSVKIEGRSFDMQGSENDYALIHDVTMTVRQSDPGIMAFADLVKIANNLADTEILAWEGAFAVT